jgi:hypothetical protein
MKKRSTADRTPEQRIAELESQLADTQSHLHTVSRKLESASSELQTSSAKLRDSQDTTRSTLDALKTSLDREKLALAFAEIGTCEYDVKSSMVRSSDMSLRLLGIRSAQPDLPYDTLLESLHPEDRAKFRKILRRR